MENVDSVTYVIDDNPIINPSFIGDFRTHLEKVYSIQITEITQLDQTVFKVDRQDGPSWVARVFPSQRSLDEAQGDADILYLLQEINFPAERLAHSNPISELQGRQILVTEFISGSRPKRTQSLYQSLGDLLGQLQTSQVNDRQIVHKGGAWHHLSCSGGISDEISAARALLHDSKHLLGDDDLELYEELKRYLEEVHSLRELPTAVVHPDFVPANIIQSSDTGLTVIDWTGAGIGPRIFSLGFLCWAAGNQSLKYVDSVIAGYRKHIRLEPTEVEIMIEAIKVRPLTLACWEFGKGRKPLAEVFQQVRSSNAFAKEIADSVRRASDTNIEEIGEQATKSSGVIEPPPGVGETGLAVAAIRAAESRRPDRLFHDPFAGAFVKASGWTSKNPKGSARANILKAWIVARTLFFDELIITACQNGCQQVVILGAGFDARAFRLQLRSDVRCFEIDTADVLNYKGRVLQEANAAAQCDRIPITCDLREDWPGALTAAGFDPGQKSVWLAEGLVMYLDPDDVDRLLKNISRLAAPGSHFGADMSTQKPNSESTLGYAHLRRSSAPEEPVSWLLTYGWSAELADPRELLQAHGRSFQLNDDSPGESIVRERPFKAHLISAVKS